MTRKSSDLTAARHWEMLLMLPASQPGIKTAELESKLRDIGFIISRKTIQRDLVNLSTIFPITNDEEGKTFYWYWMPGFRKQLPGYSVPEALSLQLIEDYMKPLLPQTIISVLESNFKLAREKLEALKTDNKSATWLDKIRVVTPSMPQNPPAISSDVLEKVQNALINDTQLNVEYRKPQSDKTDRWDIHPLGMVQRGLVSYLVCTIFDYGDVRLIAVHRIEAAEALDKEVRRPEGFSLDDYINQGALHFGGGENIKLEAIVHPYLLELLKESPLSEDMKIISKGDVHKVKATVVNSWQLDWWIKSQGDYIEVLKPAFLRKRIKDDLEKTLKSYK